MIRLASRFGGVGRPSNAEQATRRQQFVRLILTGHEWDQAVLEARIQPLRAVVILRELHRDGLLAA